MLATRATQSFTESLSASSLRKAASSDGNYSDAGPIAYTSGPERSLSVSSMGTAHPPHRHLSQSQKFPHTRAQLSNIAREYHFRKLVPGAGTSLGSASSGTESDVDDGGKWEDEARVSSSLVRQVAALLDEEKEDELKELLKTTFEMDNDAVSKNVILSLILCLIAHPDLWSVFRFVIQVETPVLDLMHAHKDDTTGVPFLFLTPTRRPISRPSSRASSHSFRLAPGPSRPDTPASTVSAPNSPSLLGPIRRPHTPITSPLAAGHGASSYLNISPTSSPTLAHVSITSHFAASLPASPLSSPRLLNAKASEFKPTPRPLSAASSNPGSSSLAGRRAETPSPDLWAHGSVALRGSKIAIASPLIPDNTLLPPGTPPRAHTPTSPLRIASSTAEDGDEEEDPFDPFVPKEKAVPQSFHATNATTNLADFDNGLGNSSNSASSLSDESALLGGYPHPSMSYPDMFGEFDAGVDLSGYGSTGFYADPQSQALSMNAGVLGVETEYDQEAVADGMTPFDVLSSVFGATLAPSELEEALAVNGYDFERAMQWLIDRARPSPSPPTQARQPPFTYGGGVHVVPRGQAGFIRGGRAGFAGGFVPSARGRFNGRPIQGGNRVCRYFLAGECMRADCRFRYVLRVFNFCLVNSARYAGDINDFAAAMIWTGRYVDSGCVEHVQRGRAASSCIICRTKLMYRALLTLCRMLTSMTPTVHRRRTQLCTMNSLP